MPVAGPGCAAIPTSRRLSRRGLAAGAGRAASPFPAPVPPVPPARPGPGEPALPSQLCLELLLSPWGLISCRVPARDGLGEEEEEDEDTRGQSLALSDPLLPSQAALGVFPIHLHN